MLNSLMQVSFCFQILPQFLFFIFILLSPCWLLRLSVHPYIEPKSLPSSLPFDPLILLHSSPLLLYNLSNYQYLAIYSWNVYIILNYIIVCFNSSAYILLFLHFSYIIILIESLNFSDSVNLALLHLNRFVEFCGFITFSIDLHTFFYDNLA